MLYWYLHKIFLRSFQKDLPKNLNGKDVSRSESHKHLGLVFDPKLNFDMHLKGKFSIINNGITLLRKLRHSIPRKLLQSIYETFFETSFRLL